MNQINDLSGIADELNAIAARLSGFQPIMHMLSDAGNIDAAAGNILELVGDAAERCNSDISEIAMRLNVLSREKG